MAKREVWSVRWVSHDRLWHVENGGRLIGRYLLKNNAVFAGAANARSRWNDEEILAQLKVFNKNGRIAFERSYGKDPRRTKG